MHLHFQRLMGARGGEFSAFSAFSAPKFPPRHHCHALSQTGGNLGATGKVWKRFPHRDWGKTPLTPTAAVPQTPQNSNSGSTPAGPARPRFAPNREKTGKSQFPGARDSQNRRFPPQKGAGLGRKELVLCPNPAAPPPAAQSFPFFQAPSLTDLMDAPSKFHFFSGGRGERGITALPALKSHPQLRLKSWVFREKTPNLGCGR